MNRVNDYDSIKKQEAQPGGCASCFPCCGGSKTGKSGCQAVRLSFLKEAKAILQKTGIFGQNCAHCNKTGAWTKDYVNHDMFSTKAVHLPFLAAYEILFHKKQPKMRKEQVENPVETVNNSL